MTLQSIPLSHPALDFRGAYEVKTTPHGVMPRRLPARVTSQSPDPGLEFMANMPSGVRLTFRSDTSVVELDVHEMGVQMKGNERLRMTFDLYEDGEFSINRAATKGPTVVIDRATMPPGIEMLPGVVSTLQFDELRDGMKTIEIWLPQCGSVEIRGLRIEAGARIERADITRPRWVHYGSSISHGMEAATPAHTWPGTAARIADMDLTNLGLAGQCQLDPGVARVIRDGAFDLISLKLGINVVNLDTMRDRTFAPAVQGFLDTIREGKPTTPILVVSPIFCPVAEDHPGPTIPTKTGIRVPPRTADLSYGALSLKRIREMLEWIVAVRRSEGDANLHYLNGLELFGEGDVHDLPDGLHPNAAGLVRIGERFAAKAFGAGGPLRAG
jgi:hypothetical protein